MIVKQKTVDYQMTIKDMWHWVKMQDYAQPTLMRVKLKWKRGFTRIMLNVNGLQTGEGVKPFQENLLAKTGTCYCLPSGDQDKELIRINKIFKNLKKMLRVWKSLRLSDIEIMTIPILFHTHRFRMNRWRFPVHIGWRTFHRRGLFANC